MKTIKLTKKDIYRGHLILVNRQHAIHSEWKPNTETLPAIDKEQDIPLTAHAGTMLFQLLKICKAENEIIPISGYRSFREQQHIYCNSLHENGEEFTLKYVAFPGCSEHQTGLAVDVAKKKRGN